MPTRRRPARLARPASPRVGGFALLEVLIAMVVIALWLLAHAGLQLNSLKFQKSAQSRLVALSLASDLGERMEANGQGARGGDYVLGATSAAATPARNCVSLSCTPSQMADYDLAQWRTRAVSALVLDSLQVEDATPAGGLTTYTITMSWKEAAGNRRYASGQGASAPVEEVFTLVTTKVVRN